MEAIIEIRQSVLNHLDGDIEKKNLIIENINLLISDIKRKDGYCIQSRKDYICTYRDKLLAIFSEKR